MLMYDDATYLDFLIQTLRGKGVRIVDFPTIYDHSSVIPFLLVNDHSIIVVRNPKKDILALLKLIMRRGCIFFKQKNMPIKINLTIWVLVEVIPYVDKGVKGSNEKKPPKKLQEMIHRDFGIDFHSLFDIVIDLSQYSNVDILGTDYLKFQENLMLDRFSLHLDQNLIELPSSRFVFDYKDLKCQCKKSVFAHNQGKPAPVSLAQLSNTSHLSIGEVFIQYYYLCQRRLHAVNDTTPNFYREERLPASEINWITLADVVKIKKLADNINFMRLYFLKSSDD